MRDRRGHERSAKDGYLAGVGGPTLVADLAEAILRGDIRAGARLMRDLDDGDPGAEAVLRQIYPQTGKAFVLGVTGNPGAGKSTVVDALIAHYRKLGQKVG